MGESPGLTSFETGRLRHLLTPFPSLMRPAVHPGPVGGPQPWVRGLASPWGSPALEATG